jgi:hypothetical protein
MVALTYLGSLLCCCHWHSFNDHFYHRRHSYSVVDFDHPSDHCHHRSFSPSQLSPTLPGVVETLSQTLTGLDVSRLYTLDISHLIFTSSYPCTFTVDLGTLNLVNVTSANQNVQPVNGRYPYTRVTIPSITPPSSNADLTIGFICTDQAISHSSAAVDDVAFTPSS